MLKKTESWTRRQFAGGLAAIGAGAAAPIAAPALLLAQNQSPAKSPSERIVMGAIGIGGRGTEDFEVAPGRPSRADGRQLRHPSGPPRIHQEYDRCGAGQQRLQDVQRRAGVAGPARYRGGANCDQRSLALPDVHLGRRGRQGYLLRKAPLADNRRELRTGRDRPSLRPRLPGGLPSGATFPT